MLDFRFKFAGLVFGVESLKVLLAARLHLLFLAGAPFSILSIVEKVMHNMTSPEIETQLQISMLPDSTLHASI